MDRVCDRPPESFPIDKEKSMPSSEIHENFFLRFIEKIETSRKKRNLSGTWDIVFKVIAVSYSLFLIYTAVSGVLSSSVIRGIFILFISIMIFMNYPASKVSPLHRPSVVDFILIGFSIPTFLNFCIDYNQMAWRGGEPVFRDIFFGVIAIVLVFEACRRAMGAILPTLAFIALVYAYWGPYFPGIFGHQGFSFSIIVQDMYASMNAIFGIVAYIFSAYVVLFIIMGAFFEKIGADTFFIDLPVALTSRFRGGPAKASVVASGFFGMISGSATANTVTTGAFTIPLMKKAGYPPEIAGAIEPAASTGGMFMPPIMGAGAFIMAEMMGIAYLEVVKIAFVPALLYFFSVMVMIHFESLKKDIGFVRKEDRVRAWPIFLKGWYFAVPIVVMLFFILSGRSPSLAGFYAIVSAGAIALIKSVIHWDLKKGVRSIFEGLAEGGRKSLIVGCTAGPIGIIVGVALLTGLAFKFSALVLSFTYGFKWAALLLVFVSTFVLGMGMTVTSDYLILAVLAVPALGEMGVPLIAAHLAAFWYSQSSNITPPVCIAAFAGAGIAKSNPYRTGFHAMRFSAYLYVMPFLFVYTPVLMPGGFSTDVLLTWISTFLSTIPFAAGITGYLGGRINLFQRLILFASFVLLLHSGMATDGIGLLLIAGVWVFQYLEKKKSVIDTTPDGALFQKPNPEKIE